MSYTENGDYLRILRLVYSETVINENNENSINEQLISINKSINDLIDTAQDIDDLNEKSNGTLKKQDSDTSGQSGSNDLSKSTNKDLELLKENQEFKDEIKTNENARDASIDVQSIDSLVMKLRSFSKEDKRQIYLTSKLFLCHRKGQTVSDLRQEIQEWFRNYQLEAMSKNINTADFAKPKILACETLQIFSKNFVEMAKNNDFTCLQKASEETFMYNR